MIVLLAMILNANFIHANQVIVEEVSERKATVYVPVGVTIKPGEPLYISPQVVTVPEAEPPVQEQIVVPPTASSPINSEPTIIVQERDHHKVKRNHHLMINYDSGRTEVEVTGSTGLYRGEGTSAEIDISYGYEFGYWQPWVSLASKLEKSGGTETYVTVTGLGVRLNFIENKPGNDLIPYFKIGSGYYNEDGYLDDTLVNAQGSGGMARFGLSWFPFGEIMAIDISYGSTVAKVDITGTTEVLRADYERTSLNIGYTLVF